jgi:hypothetical protein
MTSRTNLHLKRSLKMGKSKKPDLEEAKAWYGSDEYKDYQQASARASGGGITGFDVARMNAPIQIKKDWEKKRKEEKKKDKYDAPRATTPTPTPETPPAPTNNIQGLMGSYPRLGAPVLAPLPTGTLTLPTPGGGGPQLPGGGMQMPARTPMPAPMSMTPPPAAAPVPQAPVAGAPAPAPAPAAPAGGLDLAALQNAIAQRQAAARAAPALPSATPQPMLGMPNKIG